MSESRDDKSYPRFLTELWMRPDRNPADFGDWDGKSFRLLNDLKFIGTDGKEYKIPAGFVTNGASTDPQTRFKWFNKLGQWLACIVTRPMDQGAEAFAVHDYIYETPRICMNKLECDKLMYELLLLCGVSKWRAKVMYRFVRLVNRGWCPRSYVF